MFGHIFGGKKPREPGSEPKSAFQTQYEDQVSNAPSSIASSAVCSSTAYDLAGFRMRVGGNARVALAMPDGTLRQAIVRIQGMLDPDLVSANPSNFLIMVPQRIDSTPERYTSLASLSYDDFTGRNDPRELFLDPADTDQVFNTVGSKVPSYLKSYIFSLVRRAILHAEASSRARSDEERRLSEQVLLSVWKLLLSSDFEPCACHDCIGFNVEHAAAYQLGRDTEDFDIVVDHISSMGRLHSSEPLKVLPRGHRGSDEQVGYPRGYGTAESPPDRRPTPAAPAPQTQVPSPSFEQTNTDNFDFRDASISSSRLGQMIARNGLMDPSPSYADSSFSQVGSSYHDPASKPMVEPITDSSGDVTDYVQNPSPKVPSTAISTINSDFGPTPTESRNPAQNRSEIGFDQQFFQSASHPADLGSAPAPYHPPYPAQDARVISDQIQRPEFSAGSTTPISGIGTLPREDPTLNDQGSDHEHEYAGEGSTIHRYDAEDLLDPRELKKHEVILDTLSRLDFEVPTLQYPGSIDVEFTLESLQDAMEMRLYPLGKRSNYGQVMDKFTENEDPVLRSDKGGENIVLTIQFDPVGEGDETLIGYYIAADFRNGLDPIGPNQMTWPATFRGSLPAIN